MARAHTAETTLPDNRTSRTGELSLDEWYRMPEDEPGELVDGRLVEEEVPGYVHEFLVLLLGRIFGDWVLPRGGFVGGSDAKFAVGPGRGRKPDLTVYFPESPPPPPAGLIAVPPDIAVEIVSPTPGDVRRDRVDKMDDYATFGIRYYWILDPQSRTLDIFELGVDRIAGRPAAPRRTDSASHALPGRQYTQVLEAAGGTIATVPGCDGLTVDLDALWAEIGRLEKR
ncbi:MAG: Uma2 family endonuclease [Proteobacteria bacterium]|nr:Uma2 family endonuclease [Pseudomonadota bacterium]